MDFRTILSSSITLKELNLVRDEILLHPENFPEVFELIFESSFKNAWRAAWAIEKVSEKNTVFFSEKEILRLMKWAEQAKAGFLRSILAILINLPLPEEIPVSFINACFEKMVSPKEPVAVQALSMRLLEKVAQREPDFTTEITVTLQNMDLSMVSPGYLAIRRKILKRLSAKCPNGFIYCHDF